MKKRNPTIGTMVGGVELYKEDLLKIYAILKESSEDGKVKIVADDYDLDDIKEIDSLENKQIHDLRITSPKPYVTFWLEDGRAAVGAENDSAICRGIYEKVRAVLSGAKRFRRHRLYPFAVRSIAMVIVGLVLVLLYAFLIPHSDIISVAIGVIIGLLLTRVILAVIGMNDNHSVAFNRQRNELPSFWRRQRDSIIMNIVFLIVGAVLTAIVEALLRK